MQKVFIRIIAVVVMLSVSTLGSCTKDDGSQPVTITLLLLGNRPSNGRAEAAIAEINTITAERIGAVLRTRYIEWSGWMNNYQLAMASGDRNLDLVISSTTWLFGWEIAQRGGFYPLTPELLQEYAPQTWAAVPEHHWELCTHNGNIWFIPENQYTQFTNHGAFWRGDWALEGGIEDIHRFEDLELYFDAVKQNHPRAFPWDVGGAGHRSADLFDGYLRGKIPVQPIIGIPAGFYHIFQYHTYDPYTVVSYFMDGDELIEAARIFHRWGEKGFWRDEVLNYRGDTENMLAQGLTGSQQHHTNVFLGVREQMDIAQPGSDLQMFYWGKETGNVNRDVITHGAMSISASSRNVEKALQMYDLLRNDREIYMLFNHGFEGIDYIINEDGTFGRPAGFDEATDGLGTNFWGGRMDEFEPVWDTWWPGRTAFLQHLDSIASDYPLGNFVFNNSSVSAEMSALGEVMATRFPAIHFGKAGDPDRAVADLRDALRQAGFDRVIAEIQAQLDVYKEQR